MSGVSVRISGLSSAELILKRISDSAKDLSAPFKDIGEHLILTHRERWDEEESPDGVKWNPLSEIYLASKRKRTSRGRNKILVLDEYLRGSMRYEAGAKSMKFGTNIVYAKKQQDKRPFLGLTEGDNDYSLSTISDWLNGNI